MYRNYRKKYNGGNRQTRALRAKVRKAEKTKTTLKILLGVSLAAVLALGGWMVYDHFHEDEVVPPAQIEQEEDTIVSGSTPGGNGAIVETPDGDEVEVPTTGDETTGDETTGDETTGDETTGDETTGDETTGEE